MSKKITCIHWYFFDTLIIKGSHNLINQNYFDNRAWLFLHKTYVISDGLTNGWPHPTKCLSLSFVISMVTVSMQKFRRFTSSSWRYWWSKKPAIWLDESIFCPQFEVLCIELESLLKSALCIENYLAVPLYIN